MRAVADVVVALGDVIHTVGVIQIGQEGGVDPLHTTRLASCWLLVRNRTDAAAAASTAAA